DVPSVASPHPPTPPARVPPSPASGGGLGWGLIQNGRPLAMIAYAIRRIVLMLPTLFAIMVVNFFIVQAAPGGPIQQMISKLKGSDISATERVSGTGGELRNQPSN